MQGINEYSGVITWLVGIINILIGVAYMNLKEQIKALKTEMDSVKTDLSSHKMETNLKLERIEGNMRLILEKMDNQSEKLTLMKDEMHSLKSAVQLSNSAPAMIGHFTEAIEKLVQNKN